MSLSQFGKEIDESMSWFGISCPRFGATNKAPDRGSYLVAQDSMRLVVLWTGVVI